MNRHAAAVFVLLLSKSWLAAQVPIQPEFGPFSSTGMVFGVADTPNQLLHFRPDIPGSVGVEAIGGTVPHYTVDAIFAEVVQVDPGVLADVEIDAISSGNDLIPVVFSASSARIVQRIAQLTWTAMFFSFRDGTVGAQDPEPMASRIGKGLGGDVFSWITPGSSPLGEFEDEVFLDVASDRMGLSSTDELSALDIPIALMVQGRGEADPLFSPNRSQVWFSLTAASAAALQGRLPQVAAQDLSGGTVFRATWNGTAWHGITVARSANDLGLGGLDPMTADDDEELDALAVDGTLQSLPLFVYSVLAPSALPQLMAVQGQQGPKELRAQDGSSVADRVGGSDIDAVCGIDPEMGRYSRWLGTPYVATPNPRFVLSATQTRAVGTGALQLVLELNGPPPSDAILAAAPVLFEAALAGDDGAPVWIPAHWVPAWNGEGSLRLVIPLSLALNADLALRAVFGMPGTVTTSSVVYLRF